MKQFRITTQDLNQSSDEDCYLAPDDPIHAMKGVSQLGGIGSEEALANYNRLQLPTIVGSNKGQIQKEQGIEPGTQEWFKLWFGHPGR
ncbi:hypothetical protein UFOVP181_272 [uncultured Caudovirales phage]|uniref:Uncharacterized protein n=1 Tax=uncultured Caudovirales phage TaxID=2100421 RepID=A0A6J7WIZ8_9CAUD|nr:hypothetical protein UFOVP57_367 [uncultured Caudovirales phage]CAB5208972.1 hypothetical protein UFOVP181_272 [uncultured Caudovirales phage]